MKKTSKRTIGFHSEIYDTRVTVYNGAKNTAQTDNGGELPIAKLSDNRYYDAIFTAFQDFIENDMKGYYNAAATFSKKVEAAQLLFDADKRALTNAYKKREVNILVA